MYDCDTTITTLSDGHATILPTTSSMQVISGVALHKYFKVLLLHPPKFAQHLVLMEYDEPCLLHHLKTNALQ